MRGAVGPGEDGGRTGEGVGVEGEVRRPQVPQGHRRPHRLRRGGRGRRVLALQGRDLLRRMDGAGALGALQRRPDRPRRHKGRQQAPEAPHGRGGLALRDVLAAPQAPRTRAGGAARGQRSCRQGGLAPVGAQEDDGRAEEAPLRGQLRHGPRSGLLVLGGGIDGRGRQVGASRHSLSSPLRRAIEAVGANPSAFFATARQRGTRA